MPEETPQAQLPVNDTPAAPMPSAQDTAQKTPEQQAVDTAKQDGLPESATERTRAQFEKLQADFREERQRRESLEKAFTTLQPAKKDEPAPIVDPITGLIDERALTDLQRQATQARQEAERANQAIVRYERQRQEHEAYQTYPWLDPQNKKDFSQEKYNLATGIALASMVNPERFNGIQLDLKGAGEYIAKLTNLQVEKLQQDAAQQAIEQLTPKEQAALEATGSAGRRSEESSALSHEDAQTATRRGGNEGLIATMARLKALKSQAKT